MGQTIRRKIFLSYTLPLLISLLILAGMSYGLIRRSIDDGQREKLTILAADYSNRINTQLRDRMAVMTRVETLQFRRNFRDLALSSHFAKFSSPLPVLSYLDEHGQEEVKVVKGKKSDRLLNFTDAPWLTMALANRNQIVIGEVTTSTELNQPCLTIGIARYGYFGDVFEGVLRAEIPVADLAVELPELAPGRSGFGVLLDDRGNVLLSPDSKLLLQSRVRNASLMELLNADSTTLPMAALVEISGIKALAGRDVVPCLGWSVLAVLPYAEFIEPSHQLTYFTLGTALLALVIGLLMANRIAGPITRNLSRVILQTGLIAKGERELPLEIRSGDEFEEVAASLNQMSASISKALAMRDSQQSILQSIIDPLIILDPGFKILEVNTAARHLLGLDKDEQIGMTASAYLGGSVAEGEQLLDEIRRRGTLQNYETQVRSAGQKRVPVLLSCSMPDPVLNKNVGLVAILKDISDIRRAEEERLKAMTVNEALLEQSPLGIRVFDGITGQCLQVNPAAADVAGGPAEVLLSQNFLTLQPWQDSGLLTVAKTVLDDGAPRQVEKEMTSTFGKVLTARYFLSRFVIKERPHLLVIVQEVTREKLLAKERRRIEEQMLHLQKLESLGVLAGGIAHDFNNILMAVIANADLALMRLAPESPAVNYLQQIQVASSRAAELAGQMLAYSGKGKFVVERLDLNRVIKEMMHMLEVSISKKAQIRFNVSKDLPAVEADATQLRQVIMNLVINASESLGENNGIIAIATGALNCDRDYLREFWLGDDLGEGLYVYIEIADNGCGMDKETLDCLYDPFFSTKFTGRGLGMAAVLGIVRGHNGGLSVESEVGKGTTFKVLLPSASSQASLLNKDESASFCCDGGQVLLVDDEDMVLAVGKAMLEELGFEVLTARNGLEGLALFREHRDTIDLIVMDLTMPQMGGEEAFREMRKLSSDVKVIITSGYNEQEITPLFAGKGLTGFIQKPFSLSNLRKSLAAVTANNL